MEKYRHSILCLSKKMQSLVKRNSDSFLCLGLIEAIAVLVGGGNKAPHFLDYTISHLNKKRKRLIKENKSIKDFSKGVEKTKVINDLSEAINLLTKIKR